MFEMPVWLVFACAFALVFLGVEAGIRIGRALGVGKADDPERQPTASAISSAVTGLAAFILSFTFGLVADRYDMRSSLVRDEANAISTVYQLADILPDSDRERAQALVREYVALRLAVHASRDPAGVPGAVRESTRIQEALWRLALAHARQSPNTNLSGQLVQAVNAISDLQANRMSVAVHQRIPMGLWMALVVLMLLSALAVGYVNAVDETRRSRLVPVLAAAFALVVALIAVLDRPDSTFIDVSQQPLIDLGTAIAPAPGR